MSLVAKVRNPETGRLIGVGSAVYNKLVQEKKLNPKKITVEKYSEKFVPPQNLRIPPQIKNYPVDRSNVKWGLKKPTSVGERKFVKQNCGESCFLIPQSNKFPICNKDLPCTYNCRGLKGASSRAGEWKYEKVLQRSKELTEAMGCYKNNSRSVYKK